MDQYFYKILFWSSELGSLGAEA